MMFYDRWKRVRQNADTQAGVSIDVQAELVDREFVPWDVLDVLVEIASFDPEIAFPGVNYCYYDCDMEWGDDNELIHGEDCPYHRVEVILNEVALSG